MTLPKGMAELEIGAVGYRYLDRADVSFYKVRHWSPCRHFRPIWRGKVNRRARAFAAGKLSSAAGAERFSHHAQAAGGRGRWGQLLFSLEGRICPATNSR